MYKEALRPVWAEINLTNLDYNIKQIKDKKYFESLEEYKNNMLLVGINYDRKTKTHECKIEKLK